MKIYGRFVDGALVEIIEPWVDETGKECPIEQRFHADFVALLVDITADRQRFIRGSGGDTHVEKKPRGTRLKKFLWFKRRHVGEELR